MWSAGLGDCIRPSLSLNVSLLVNDCLNYSSATLPTVAVYAGAWQLYVIFKHLAHTRVSFLLPKAVRIQSSRSRRTSSRQRRLDMKRWNDSSLSLFVPGVVLCVLPCVISRRLSKGAVMTKDCHCHVCP